MIADLGNASDIVIGSDRRRESREIEIGFRLAFTMAGDAPTIHEWTYIRSKPATCTLSLRRSDQARGDSNKQDGNSHVPNCTVKDHYCEET